MTWRAFVTGTDTGVGKTLISLLIIACCRARGWRAAALKPIETGVADVDALGEDGARLAAAATVPLGVDGVSPYRFAAPVAPLLAARRQASAIDLDRIAQAVDAAAAFAPDVLLIEGAGGLLVPVTESVTMADLARRLGAELIVVARASVGMINHTVLTIEAARRRRLDVAGVVLSHGAERVADDVCAENADTISRTAGVAILGVVPPLPEEPDALSAHGHHIAALLELAATRIARAVSRGT